ncbi:hypothetical protein B5K06_27830 [Rhizobium grahamii]|uniref:HTH araC/xylS-type domain-containing protein n=1 Tax=Rhizobium grahamii TaxID=1120045 RepID=A0A370KH38_9HYPH|nr:hypothetical protein B5K06_27830 [Rhizobium grahamii]
MVVTRRPITFPTETVLSWKIDHRREKLSQFDQVGVAAQVKWAQCQGLLEQEGGGLLVHSKTSLIENALDVGYGNAFQFTRTFKRTFGQTPTQLRPSALGIQ